MLGQMKTMSAHQIEIIQNIGLYLWHGVNVTMFGLTISPALENTEAAVRILSGAGVFVSAMVALYFTIKKNRKKTKDE